MEEPKSFVLLWNQSNGAPKKQTQVIPIENYTIDGDKTIVPRHAISSQKHHLPKGGKKHAIEVILHCWGDDKLLGPKVNKQISHKDRYKALFCDCNPLHIYAWI